MSDGGRPAVDQTVPVRSGSIALVEDRGDTVWVLVCTDRPNATGGTDRCAEQWIVFPRSGFIVTLLDAVEQLLPGAECPASCPKGDTSVH